MAAKNISNTNAMIYNTPEVTEEDDFLFDLRGYLLLPSALPERLVSELSSGIDAIPPLKPKQWHGHVHRNDYSESWGYNLQNIVEGGPPFEEAMDCPGFLPWVKRYAGHDGLFIDEALVTVRGPGQGVSLHSGGHKRRVRTQYRVATGGADGVSDLEWRVGQLNVMMALTDVGPGDGGTMVIPGSHKSNLLNPGFTAEGRERMGAHKHMAKVPGAVEIFMKAGDVLLFVDSIAHGSAPRTNPGERRFVLYRYGPSWGRSRYEYLPSDGLLARLTEARRKLIQPQRPLVPPLEEQARAARLNQPSAKLVRSDPSESGSAATAVGTGAKSKL